MSKQKLPSSGGTYERGSKGGLKQTRPATAPAKAKPKLAAPAKSKPAEKEA
ncbi:MAG: hypothetical protein N4A53_08090 [Pelagimonas sp.]|jgi:hypothetical protein|nr:hypothetical protein [Pelagimonas sp.]